jgi:GNAT superfamily N-acetyltransferase
MEHPSIRPARPDEARGLSELALRSKAHWGYAPDFLEACRLALTLTPAYIEKQTVAVLEEAGGVAGFYALCGTDDAGRELDHLYLAPSVIGRGYGKLLWQHALDAARQLGWTDFTIAADPHAEQFYLTMGAERIGDIESEAKPGRRLPLLRMKLI